MIFMLFSTLVLLSCHPKLINLILKLPYGFIQLFFEKSDEVIITANSYSRFSTSKNRSNGI